jgi:hypothetical protein
MKEFDCLEMFSITYMSEYDYHEEKYYNMLWEKKYGWKHIFMKEIYREYTEYDCGSMADDVPPIPLYYPSWEYVRTDKLEILDFELGKYGVDTGYYYESRYGLWFETEDGLEYWWDYEIIKTPGVALNRDIILQELGL